MRRWWAASSGIRFVLAVAILVALWFGYLAATSDAADRVPTRQRARAWFVRSFPPSAPAVLLKDKRARHYRTKWLRVAPAPRCRRGERQVKCHFEVVLRPKKAPRAYGRIRCRGDLWGKLRDGKMIGRVGHYRCLSGLMRYARPVLLGFLLGLWLLWVVGQITRPVEAPNCTEAQLNWADYSFCVKQRAILNEGSR